MARDDHQPWPEEPERPERTPDDMRKMCGRTVAELDMPVSFIYNFWQVYLAFSTTNWSNSAWFVLMFMFSFSGRYVMPTVYVPAVRGT